MADSRPEAAIAEWAQEAQAAGPLLDELRSTAPSVSLVLVGPPPTSYELSLVRALGAAGWLTWDDVHAGSLRAFLVAAIRGHFVLSPGAAAPLLGLPAPPRRDLLAAPALTAREHNILRHLASGRTHEHIAALDGVGLRTVKRTIAALELKLDASSLFGLGAKAAELGLLN